MYFVLFATVIFVAAYAAEQYVPKDQVAAIAASLLISATAAVILITAAAKQQ